MDELYQLPDGWEWKKFGEVFTIERGGSPRPIKEYITEANDGINWIKIGDTVKGERYITQTAQKIKKEGLYKTRLVQDGDFVLSNSMSFGRPYIVKITGAIHDGWILIRKKVDYTDRDFFYYLLSSNFMYQQFVFSVTGTTVKNLNSEIVRNVDIPLPPLEEQKRIVSKLDDIFSKLDRAIQLNQENIDEANAYMSSVLNEVFSELEEKYEVKKVVDSLDYILTGTTPPKKEQKYYDTPTINWYSPSDFGKTKILTVSKNMINKIAIVDRKAKMYEKDTLLLVAIGATVGKIGILKEEASSNQQITALKFKENIDVDFAYYWFSFIKRTIIKTASSATMPIINQTAIKALKFIVVPLEEQKKIVVYLDNISSKMDKIKSLQIEKLQELKALKASILDSAFRGEL